MGFVYTEITLKNTGDVLNERNGLIKEQDVRQITVKAMVDTGASTVVINEEIRQQLGIGIWHGKEITLANDAKIQCQIAESVEIHWKNRASTLRPMVVPGAKTVLLGALALEDMDLVVDSKHLELIGAHGDEPIAFAM